MIQVEKLTKKFGSIAALDEVSFEIQKGEVVGLLGPNGAGKTTTMRILTGAMPPTSGSVRVAGHDVAAEPIQVKRHVGYLPEVPPLYPEMRVRAYLRFVAELKGVPKSKRGERVERALAQCWLEDRAQQPIEQLSKGYKQRVGIAQAILHRPDLLILDEPTSGLDPRQIIEVRQLVRELAGEHTVVLSSHILSEVGAVCERVVVVNRGRVVATDTVEELARRFGGGAAIQLVVDGPTDAVRSALAQVDGVVSVADPRPVEALGAGCWSYAVGADAGSDPRSELANVVVGGGWKLIELARPEIGLEEIFLKLTESSTSDAEGGSGPTFADTTSTKAA